MKPISLPVAELKNVLTGLGKVIPRRVTLPVLNSIKVERTQEGRIALTGTDLDRHLTGWLEHLVEGEPVSFLVPYDELNEACRACGKDDTISVRGEEQDSKWSAFISRPVAGQLVEHRCETIAAEEYPPTPLVEGPAIPLPEAVRTSILQAFECASTDETRQILNGAYLDVSKADGHYVVGTNGRLLFSSNSFKLGLPASLVIPTHRFLGWKEFSQDGEWRLQVGAPPDKEDALMFQLTSLRWRYVSRSTHGNYPNWRQAIPGPDSFRTTVDIEPDSLGDLIRTIDRMPCHDAVNLPVALKVTGRTLALLGKPRGAEAWTKVEVPTAKARGRDAMVTLNRHSVTKALQFGLNRIEIIDELGPVRLSREGRQMIVMPVRPDAGPRHQSTTPAPPIHPPAASEAAQPERNHAMSRTTAANASNTSNTANGHNPAQPAEAKPGLEIALDQIETIKGSYREAIRGLNGLADLLKQAQREQKSSDKEVQSVRHTLRSLQTIRI